MTKAKYTDDKVLSDKIDEYFEKACADEIEIIGGKEVKKYNPPTISGMALYLGFQDRQSIYDYIERDEKFSYTIKKAIARIEDYAEKQLFIGNSTGAIFWLKNRGWKDKTEVDSNVNLGDKLKQITVKFEE